MNKIIEIVSRDETGEYFHYPTFEESDKHFKNEELKYMSNFTRNYLKGIDYDHVLKQRIDNYRTLKKYLTEYNKINLENIDLSYMYPLFIENGEELRIYLKQNNIYSQMLWPNILSNGSSKNEIEIARNMVLLPIDQRYNEHQMHYIIKTINNFKNKQKIKIKL